MSQPKPDKWWEDVLSKPPQDWVSPVDLTGVDVGLSHFEDEGSLTREVKDLGQMWAAACGTGATHTSARFLGWEESPGGKVVTTHIEKLTLAQVGEYAQRKADAGLETLSLGGTGGKVYYGDDDTVLVGPADGKKEPVKWVNYREIVREHFRRTRKLGTVLYRGFGFYGDPDDVKRGQRRVQRSWARDRVADLGGIAREEGVYFGVEQEPNLIFGTGGEIVELLDELGLPNLVYVPDLGNMAAWGMPADQIVGEFLAGLKHSVHMHIKDYSPFGPKPAEPCGMVVEKNLAHFVPCNIGCSGHLMGFSHMSMVLAALNAKAQSIGLPGYFVEGEFHLKGGGQFGGFSGPDGLQVGTDALIAVLAAAFIRCRTRTFGRLLQTRSLG